MAENAEIAATGGVSAAAIALATVAETYDDGLTLIPDGQTDPTEKHYKCSTAVDFFAGQRVAVAELAGSKIVMFGVGEPSAGQGSGRCIPAGGSDGQVLLKDGADDYKVKWGDINGALPTGGSAGQVLKKSSATNYACTWGTVDGTLPSGGSDGQVLLKNGSTNYAAKWGDASASKLASGSNSLTLSTKTLTPSAAGFEFGTASYPITLRGKSIVLYYSTYKYCTLACNSAGKLTVDGTAIN